MSGKLVRDRIPELISARTGTSVKIRLLTVFERRDALRAKIDEEVAEYDHAHTRDQITEELADILEVVYALGKANSISFSELEHVRWKKANERGSFDEGIWLEGPKP